jgi:transposase
MAEEKGDLAIQLDRERIDFCEGFQRNIGRRSRSRSSSRRPCRIAFCPRAARQLTIGYHIMILEK